MTFDKLHQQLGLRSVINVSGTMTWLGASIAIPEVVQAVAAMLPQFVEMSELHRVASEAIAAACGTEAGFVTASSAAAITLGVAAAMTGDDPGAIERLPDTGGLAKNEVLIQTGHLVHYGAPIEQAIRLAGAKVVALGQSTSCHGYQLEGAMTPRTCAAVYVVSHHAVSLGAIDLGEFVRICHARGVPVIVDAASEYDLRRFADSGADLVLYSAHKFLGGATAGIVAGRKNLVRSAYLQNRGIGRGMKVGKEGVVGVIAALHAWAQRDHAAVRAREASHLALWQQAVATFEGVQPSIEADPTGNPLDRLKVKIDPQRAHISAWDLADALASETPPIYVRDHEVAHGFFFLDPCNLHEGQARIVAERLEAELQRARKPTSRRPSSTLDERQRRKQAAALRWPDGS